MLHVRGGTWTALHKGTAYDTIRGCVNKGESLRWCRKYGLLATSSFAVQRFTEAGAVALAFFGCERMQNLYDSYVQFDSDRYIYTDNVIDESCAEEPLPDVCRRHKRQLFFTSSHRGADENIFSTSPGSRMRATR